MRIAVCDDDVQERERVVDALHGWDPTRTAECFAEGSALLRAAERRPPFTIAFLDIYMPKEDGVQIAKNLQAVSPKTGIVFVTTSQEHAVEAFALQAVHYLVKPVTTAGIREAFARIQRLQQEMRPVLSVKVGRGSQLLYLDEIRSLESYNHQVVITLKGGKTVTAYTRLSDLCEQLDDSFLLIRRGLVVNMEYIAGMQADFCLLQNGQKVLLSRKGRAAIRGAYNEYVFRRLSARCGLDAGGGE